MRVLVRLGAFVLLFGLGIPATASAGAPHTWHLVDYEQSDCNDGNPSESTFGVYVDGRWDSRLQVGADQLPSRAKYSTIYAPIPPGRSNGEYALAYVTVDLAPSTRMGNHVVTIWVKDGATRETAPFTVQVRADCGY